MHPLIGIGISTAIAAWLLSKDKDSKMPAVQKQFDAFHSNIKLDIDDEKANLRAKRDTLIKTLKNNLDADIPTFEQFHQGSYSMHTGVVPLDGNYDIDVGLVFDCQRDAYPDPVQLKKSIRDALSTNGRTVNIRRPCVTVNYMRNGDPEYHVDLAIYSKRDDGLLDLAKGKESSRPEYRTWDRSNPKELTRLICSAYADPDELAQYRRCIRYIKRWRDIQFRNGGAPLSIALTVAAMQWFAPRFGTSGKPTDLIAMLDWITSMLSNFHSVSDDEGEWYERLAITLPVTPHNDLMGSMTKGQMNEFKRKLQTLRDALNDAYDEELPEDACKTLNKQFGDDFPTPDKTETAKSVAPPVIGTGTSA